MTHNSLQESLTRSKPEDMFAKRLVPRAIYMGWGRREGGHEEIVKVAAVLSLFPEGGVRFR